MSGDTTGIAAASQQANLSGDSTAERFDNITPASVVRRPRRAVPSAAAGPAAAHVQILLDRAHYSPGVIDGAWGKNVIKAVKWFQASQGMDSTGRVDSGTYAALLNAGGPAPVVTRYTVVQKDVAGPFVAIPTDPYEQAKLSCMCYSSVSELLAEKFHATPRLLAQMNPGVVLDSVAVGTVLWVPNVAGRDTDARATERVAKILISRDGFWTHALDSAGRILRHFPSTLGASYDPSPTGDFSVTRVAPNPKFYYQPDLFADEEPGQKNAWLPEGPNSPVGVMWIALSKPHYGIHGTPNPSAIGYTSSHGCVRLTNWDAMSLSRQVFPGTPVQFQ